MIKFMSPEKSPFNFNRPQINLYVNDVELSSQFYVKMLGFKETFRTPKEGRPVHIELTLDNFILGVAHVSETRKTHGFDVSIGSPQAEVCVWTKDVDGAYNYMIEKGVKGLSAPHDFLNRLRSAWVADPDGNPIQIVSQST